jgi:hypothetical protein
MKDGSMAQLEATVHTIARRMGFQVLLRAAVVSLSLGLAVAAPLVLAQRLLCFAASPALLALVPLWVAAAAALGAGISRWPGAEEAALRADAQLNLHERLTSALTAGTGPLPDLLRADAENRAAAIDARGLFPIRWPRRAALLPILGAALLVALLLPPLDLLGWQAARNTRAAERNAARQATSTAQKELAHLARRAGRQGLGDAAQAVGSAERSAEAVLRANAPDEIRQAALQAAKELEKSLKAQQAAPSADGEKARQLLQQALRAVSDWRRQAGGPSLEGPPGDVARPAASPTSPHVIREQPTPPEPEAAAELNRRLVEAGATAEVAQARQRVPWRYRNVVRRYFAPTPSPHRP